MTKSVHRTSPHWSLAFALALALASTVLLFRADAAAPPAQQVLIEQFTFDPAALTVPVGTVVTWTNKDGTIHTVTSTTKAFASDGLDQGGTFSHTFTAPGTYAYSCKLHPRMTGTVTVQ
jgi:plastocyanin